MTDNTTDEPTLCPRCHSQKEIGHVCKWEDINEQAIAAAKRSSIPREWYVLRCDSQKIAKAVDILGQVGFPTFAPVEEKHVHVKGSRHKGIRRFPIMSGYVITGFREVPNWFWLFNQKELSYLYSVVCRDGRPAPIPSSSLERLYGIHQTATASLPGAKSLKAGDHIRVTQGGWRGLETKLIDIQDGECEYIVELFGRQVKRRSPIADVEAA